MFNLQGSEIIVILLLALVVLGPEKLPDAIRKFSQTYAELKKMGSGFQSELKSALDEPMREMRETADLVKSAADPAKIAEQAEREAHRAADLAKQADADAAKNAADSEPNPADSEPNPADGGAEAEHDDRPHGVNDPGSDTVATPSDTVATPSDTVAAPPDGPINQIAAANASSALQPPSDDATTLNNAPNNPPNDAWDTPGDGDGADPPAAGAEGSDDAEPANRANAS